MANALLGLRKNLCRTEYTNPVWLDIVTLVAVVVLVWVVYKMVLRGRHGEGDDA